MVETQLTRRDIRDPGVLRAMGEVPREEFVPPGRRGSAYEDGPLPIGGGQTISQPYIVALMAQAIEAGPADRVLEVGTGSGYAAAVLSRMVGEVYTVERIEELALEAAERCSALGYDNVHVLTGDGTLGWPEHAPYDAILASTSGPEVPTPLKDQLRVGGVLIMPVGGRHWDQRLVRLRKTAPDHFVEEYLGGVAFVPLIGRAGW